MKKSKLWSFTILSISFLYACQSNAQQDKVLFRDTVLKYSVMQSDLDKYLAYRNLTDTTGKTKDYIWILKSAMVRLHSKWAPLLNKKQVTYESAIADAEAWFIKRHLVNKVLVVKSERKMYLLKDSNIVKTYSIALGPSPVGQKEYEGDGKTPEGIYTLDWQKWNSTTFHSFHISYPNKIDSARAKTKGLQAGSNIMVHGTSKGFKQKKDWTNGCIALSNKDMADFRNLVFQDTEIEIKK